MTTKKKSDPARGQTRDQRPSGRSNAWLLGSSVTSLASAVYLIRDAKVPASQIHLIESRRTSEDGLAIIGDPVSGYDHRAVYMLSLSDIYIKDKSNFAIVPYNGTVKRYRLGLLANKKCK